MIEAVATLTLMGLSLGLLLAVAARCLRVADEDPIAARIEALLPGSQCGQCGFPGCAPAAAAVAAGECDPTFCPPGGKSLARQVAELLGIEIDLSGLEDGPARVAVVDESICIGCTRCFKVCPTDAIVGGPRMIHGVLSDACTGCDNCVPVCPTACISLVEVQPTLATWHWALPREAA